MTTVDRLRLARSGRATLPEPGSKPVTCTGYPMQARSRPSTVAYIGAPTRPRSILTSSRSPSARPRKDLSGERPGPTWTDRFDLGAQRHHDPWPPARRLPPPQRRGTGSTGPRSTWGPDIIAIEGTRPSGCTASRREYLSIPWHSAASREALDALIDEPRVGRGHGGATAPRRPGTARHVRPCRS
jgi:hypothetical protein